MKRETRQIYYYTSRNTGERRKVYCTRLDYLFLKLYYDINGLTPDEYEEYQIKQHTTGQERTQRTTLCALSFCAYIRKGKRNNNNPQREKTRPRAEAKQPRGQAEESRKRDKSRSKEDKKKGKHATSL